MLMRKLIWGILRVYQLTLSYWVGRQCRFTPTCSHYMQEAVMIHGVTKGLSLGIRRFFRCHPWGGHGFDPVPPMGYKSPNERPKS